jgi:3-methyladenine DNA glycosylase AlkC
MGKRKNKMKKENPNAFKNWINETVVVSIGASIKGEYPAFQVSEFNKLSNELAPLELKARVMLITTNLRKYLPHEYAEALKIIVLILNQEKLKGFALWPFSEFISNYGTDHLDQSMGAMVILTKLFTSEFAIRPFLLKDHQRVLSFMYKLATSENHHVRRFVSEGTRPILPWGGKIPAFLKDPELTMPLLESLKYDEELYVRKSVANHLNDHAKNHPKLVTDTLRRWEKSCPKEHLDKILWIKRHALRILIKKGDVNALKLMGVNGAAKIKLKNFLISKKSYKRGEQLNMNVEMKSMGAQKQKLIIDYAIDFLKSNGKYGRKVYKLKSLDLKPKDVLKIQKNHSLRPITTMKYYPGKHFLVLQVNGLEVKKISWELK